jgi:hypothetical protein
MISITDYHDMISITENPPEPQAFGIAAITVTAHSSR